MQKFRNFADYAFRIGMGMLAGSLAVAILIGMAFLLQIPEPGISSAVTIVLLTALSANIGAALIATTI